MKPRSLVIGVVIAALLTACAPQLNLITGDSVRALSAQQTDDAEATARNGTTTPQGSDPDRTNNAVNEMRQGVTKRDGQAKGVTINVGTSNRGGS